MSATWYQSGMGGQDTVSYINLDSVKRKGQAVEFWVKSYKRTSIPDRDYQYEMILASIDCASNLYAVKQFMRYSKDGQVIKTAPYMSKPPMSAIVPESYGEIWATVACSKKPNNDRWRTFTDPTESTEYYFFEYDPNSSAE